MFHFQLIRFAGEHFGISSLHVLDIVQGRLHFFLEQFIFLAFNKNIVYIPDNGGCVLVRLIICLFLFLFFFWVGIKRSLHI